MAGEPGTGRDRRLTVGVDRSCPLPQPFRAVAPSVVYLTLLFFVTFISRFIFSPLMPTIGQDIAITSGQAGSVFFMASIGGLAGSLSAGVVSARIDHRGTLFVAALGTAAVLGVSVLAQSVWALRVLLLLLGFFAGLNQPSVVATITAMVRRDQWGTALSVQQSAPPLSLVVGPLGRRGAALGLLVARQPGVGRRVRGGRGVGFLAFPGVGAFPGDPPRLALVRPMARGRSFWLMILLMALGMGAQVGVYTMMPLFLTTERGMEVGAANTLIGLANLSPLVMVFVAGRVSDRIGERRPSSPCWYSPGLRRCSWAWRTGRGSSLSSSYCLPSPCASSHPRSRPWPARYSRTSGAWPPPWCRLWPSSMGGGLVPAALGYAGQHATFALGFVVTGVVVVLGSVGALFLVLLEDDQIEDGC